MVANPGKMFEEDFKRSVPEGVFLHRIRDSGSDKQKLFGVRNICDYILYRYPALFLLEMKSHKGKSIPFGALTADQVRGLAQEARKTGIRAGFLFNFRELEETWYVPAGLVALFIEEDERKSFPVVWCRENGRRVDQHKLRTRYRYEVDRFLDEI